MDRSAVPIPQIQGTRFCPMESQWLQIKLVLINKLFMFCVVVFTNCLANFNEWKGFQKKDLGSMESNLLFLIDYGPKNSRHSTLN